MPVIPVYDQTLQAPSIRANADAFGIGAFTAGVAGLTREVSNYYDEKEKRDANQFVIEAFSEFQMANSQAMEEEKKKGADGFTARTDEKYDEMVNKWAESAPSDFARQAFIEKTHILKPRIIDSAIGFESVENQRRRIETLEKSQNNYEVLVQQNPEMFDDYIAMSLADVQNAKNDGTLTESQAIGLTNSRVQRLYTLQTQNLIERGNLGGAEKLLKEKGQNFDSTQYGRLQNQLQGAKDERWENNFTTGLATMSTEELMQKDASGIINSVSKRYQSKAYNIYSRELKSRQKEIEKIGRANTLNSFMEGQANISPTDKNHIQAVDEFIQDNNLNSSLLNGDTEGVQKLTKIMTDTSIIPNNTVNVLVGMASNGSPKQQETAFEIIKTMEARNPKALEFANIPSETFVRAKMFNELSSIGKKPEEAIEIINFQTDPYNKPVIEAREAELKKLQKDNAIKPLSNIKEIFETEWFDGISDPKIIDDEKITTRMKADYMTLYEDNYKRYGKDQAKEITDKEFKRTYGVHNGKIMKHAPSVFYPVKKANGEYMDDGWIQSQVVLQVRNMPKYKDIDEDRVFIVADKKTDEQVRVGKNPDYAVVVLDDKNQWQSIPRNEYSFKPNPEKAEHAVRSQLDYIMKGNIKEGVENKIGGMELNKKDIKSKIEDIKTIQKSVEKAYKNKSPEEQQIIIDNLVKEYQETGNLSIGITDTHYMKISDEIDNLKKITNQPDKLQAELKRKLREAGSKEERDKVREEFRKRYYGE